VVNGRWTEPPNHSAASEVSRCVRWNPCSAGDYRELALATKKVASLLGFVHL